MGMALFKSIANPHHCCQPRTTACLIVTLMFFTSFRKPDLIPDVTQSVTNPTSNVTDEHRIYTDQL